MPESDFMEQFNANTHTTILLCVAALIVATGMGLLTSLWATKPILRLNTAAKKIAQGKLNKKVEDKRCDEVGQVVDSFNRMAAQLQESLSALRESESRLTQFLEALPVGVIVHDATGKPTYANSTAKQILGIDNLPDTTTEQLAEYFQVYLSGTEQLYPIEKLPTVKALAGESSTVDDMDLHRSDCIIPLQIWSTPIYDENGKVVYAIVAFVDITDRQKTQKILAEYNCTLENEIDQRTTALQNSEAVLRTAQRVAHVGNWEFDVITQKITWSEEQFRIFGLDPNQGEPTYEEHLQQIHPNDRSSVEQSHAQLIATGRNDELDFRILRPNGEIRYVSGRGETVINEQGQVTKFFGTTIDITERKLSENSLRQKEQELRALVENAPDIITRLDRDYRFRYVNPRLEIETGIPAPEWIGKTELEMGFPEAIVNPWHDVLKIVFETGQEQVYESEFPCVSGMKYWSCRLVPELNDQGFVETVLNISRDMTERKQAEEALEESQSFIQRIADASPNLWYIYDHIEQRNVYSNREIAAVLGYTPEEIQAMGSAILPTIIHPDDLAKFPKHLEKILSISGDDILEIEYRMRDAKGEWRTLLGREIVFARTSEGTVKQVLGTATDITKLKQTQDLLESVFNESTDAFFLVNPQTGLTIDCNQTAVELFEATSKDELVNIEVSTLQKTPFTQKELKYISNDIERYGLWCREVEYVTKKANFFWGNLAAKPIQVAGQKINLVRVTNISDVKQTEEQLQQAKVAADAANQAKSQFLANMSHELRTPLNAILGFSQLMNKSPNLAPEDKQHLNIILRNGEHLLTLINQVLDLSKIEAGRTTLNKTSFDLFRLLNDLEVMFQLKAKNNGLQLDFERSDNVPQYVKTDELKLRQVLLNLLSNAIKFTKEGGVFLKVKNKSEQHIRASGLPKSTTIHFEIKDTGVGIDQEELESIFEAFVQAKTGKNSREGTGLGLSISRQFVQMMGGQITINSVINKGSTFEFDITVDIVKPEALTTQQPARRVIALEPNQQKYRILIVDDKRDNRQLLIELLSPLNFELREAINGIEAIETWKTWQPHLIFMDLRMPVMDGLEATKQIIKSQNSSITKIIALSAGTLEDKQAAALEAGCDHFIHKPFRETDIFETISQQIGVCFVYEQPTVKLDTDQTQKNFLSTEDLADLPAEWLACLHQATFEGDLQQMLVLIEQIPDKQLANTLASLANNFEYKELLTLTQPRDA